MRKNLRKYTSERLKATVSAEVPFGLESDVHFRPDYRFFPSKYLFLDITYAREFHAVRLKAYDLRVPTHKQKCRPN